MGEGSPAETLTSPCALSHKTQQELRDRERYDPEKRLCSKVIQEPLPLKPGILVKTSVVLVKRKMDFLKPPPGQKTLKKKERAFW